MRIYAVFDANGLPKGFYTPVVHSKIPEGAVRISKEQWHEFIRNQGQRCWDGEKVVEYVPQPCSAHGFAARIGEFFGEFGYFVFTLKKIAR